MAWNGDRAGSCRLPVDEPDGVAGPVAVEGIESVPTGIGPFAWIQDGQGVLQERNASCWRVQISAKEDGCFCGGGCDLFLDEAVDDDYRIGFVLGVCWNRNAGLYSRLCFSGHAVAGWGSMMCSMWILGGFILLALGITGEYIAKIYLEVKARPRYIVETTL